MAISLLIKGLDIFILLKIREQGVKFNFVDALVEMKYPDEEVYILRSEFQRLISRNIVSIDTFLIRIKKLFENGGRLDRLDIITNAAKFIIKRANTWDIDPVNLFLSVRPNSISEVMLSFKIISDFEKSEKLSECDKQTVKSKFSLLQGNELIEQITNCVEVIQLDSLGL